MTTRAVLLSLAALVGLTSSPSVVEEEPERRPPPPRRSFGCGGMGATYKPPPEVVAREEARTARNQAYLKAAQEKRERKAAKRLAQKAKP